MVIVTVKRTIFATMLICHLPFMLMAAICEDYNQFTHFAARLETGGDIRAVAVSGDYAYLANITPFSSTGFMVVDISNPQAPVMVGSLFSAGTNYDVDVEENHAYVVRLNQDLQVIDIADPNNPLEMGSVPLSKPKAVDAEGSWAFVVGDDSLLVSVDISNPTNPEAIDDVQLAYLARDVHAVGDFVYIALDRDGLAIVDAANPADLVLVGTLDIAGKAQSVYVSGTSAYVGASGGNDRGLYVIDVSNPSAPSLTGSITGVGTNSTFHGNDVIVAGTVAYVAGEQLFVFDISSINPTLLLETDVRTNATALQGRFAFTAAREDGLEVAQLGIHTLSNPIGGWHGGSLDNVEVDRIYVYTRFWNTQLDWGVKAFDLTNPLVPVLVGTVAMPAAWSTWCGASINGSVAAQCYAPQYGGIIGRIAFINLSAPVSVIHELDTDYTTHYCDWVGDYLYVMSFSTLRIYDVSNLFVPVELGSVEVGTSGEVQVVGDYAYVGFTVVDISDPMLPTVVGSTTPTHSSSDWPCVAINGDFAYVTLGRYLSIVDISDPTSPSVRSDIGMAGYARFEVGNGVATDGHFAYVAFFTEGVQVIDVSDPDRPMLAGNFHGLDYCNAVDYANGTVFSASHDGLVEHATQCQQPTGITQESPPTPASERIEAWPNPFNPATTIKFELAARQQVHVCVYDVTGRLVAVLAHRVFEAGPQALRWDGVDRNGLGVAGGVYFARVNAVDFRSTVKLVVLK